VFNLRLDRWGPDLLLGLSVYPQAVELPERVITLVAEALARRRPALRRLDVARILQPDWFAVPEQVGYVCYPDRFAGSLAGIADRVGYLRELGVGYLPLMPLLEPRPGPNDGGYAVRDFRRVRSGCRTPTRRPCPRCSRTSPRATSAGYRRWPTARAPGSGPPLERLGTDCQNQPEVHSIVQALRAAVRIATPAMIFKAEAIVAPEQLPAYLGTGRHAGRVCDLANHSSLMVQLWSGLAIGDARLARHALGVPPPKPVTTAWGTYVRCHDDIGWAVSDADAAAVGLSGPAHRGYLARFYRGEVPGSFAAGLDFQVTRPPKTPGPAAPWPAWPAWPGWRPRWRRATRLPWTGR
jgi:hypothetical protein